MSETPKAIRETKPIEIKDGGKVYKVILNTYITGRELRAIEGAMFNDISFTQKKDGQEFTGLNGKMLEVRQDEQIKAVVVSLDGKSEDTVDGKKINIVDMVLDLPSKVTEEIMRHVTEITEPKKETAGN